MREHVECDGCDGLVRLLSPASADVHRVVEVAANSQAVGVTADVQYVLGPERQDIGAVARDVDDFDIDDPVIADRRQVQRQATTGKTQCIDTGTANESACG